MVIMNIDGDNSPEVIKVNAKKFIDYQNYIPVGSYCMKDGDVCSTRNPKEYEGPTVWIYSEDRKKTSYSTESLNNPIVIRKGLSLYYCGFENFKTVYRSVLRGKVQAERKEYRKTFFDPELSYPRKRKISTYNLTGKDVSLNPWHFFKDYIRFAKCEDAPKELPRRYLGISQAISISKKETIYCTLYEMEGQYYYERITDIDPILSKTRNINGYDVVKEKELSSKNMTIRYKVCDKNTIIVGGYHDPQRFYELAKHHGKKELTEEQYAQFMKEIQSMEIKPVSDYKKFKSFSIENAEIVKRKLKETYEKAVLEIIKRYKGKE